MRTRPTLPLTVATLVAVALTGCSGSDPETPDAGAPATADAPVTADADAPAADGDFCAAYDEAGGTLVTPGPFQVAMPAPDTIADLSSRVEVLDAVTPPAEIATDWQTLRDLFAEVVTIAEGTPDGGVVAGPRVFEVVDELEAPSTAVGDYLRDQC